MIDWLKLRQETTKQFGKTLAYLAGSKSASAATASLPSGESDPPVTLDCAGADTPVVLSRTDYNRFLDTLNNPPQPNEALRQLLRE